MKGDIYTKAFDVPVVVKDFRDIVLELNFNTEEEALICEDIITSLERTAAATIKEEKIAQLPYIGTLTKSQLHKRLLTDPTELRELRQNTTEKEYKVFVSKKVLKIKRELKAENAIRLEELQLKKENRRAYDRIYLTRGKSAAERFLKAIKNFKPVPFNQDVEDMYQLLNNEK